MSRTIWYLRGVPYLGIMHDQFIQGQFRLTLRGTSIGVDIETSPITAKLTDLAGSLVRSYTARLSHALGETLQLLTEQEFANLPPWASSNVAMTFSGMEHRPSFDYKQIADILRQVRHDTITYGRPLKACYDYMQTALAAI